MGGSKSMGRQGPSLIILLGCVSSAAANIARCPGEGPRYGDYRCNHDPTHRVCAELKNADGGKIQWGGTDFWHLTGQPDWSSQVGSDATNPGGDWCLCMWATASLISQVGCANVHINCAATDVAWVMQHYTDGGTDLAPAKACLQQKCVTSRLSATVSLGGVSADSFTSDAQHTFRKAVAAGANVTADNVTISLFARRALSVQFDIVGTALSTGQLETSMQSSGSDGFLAVLVQASSEDNTTAFSSAVTSVEVTSVTDETPTYDDQGDADDGMVAMIIIAAACAVLAGGAVACWFFSQRRPATPRSYHKMQGGASHASMDTKGRARSSPSESAVVEVMEPSTSMSQV